MRIFCHEIHDLVLDLVEILVRLRRTDDQPRHPHRMHGHAGRGHDQTFARRYGQRDADGMPAAEHERDRRLLHPRDQLRNGESRLDVPADRVQKQQQTVDVLAFLHGREQGNDVLILGRLDVFRQRLMALDLADDRQRVDRPAGGLRGGRAEIDQLLPRLFFFFRFAHVPCSCL